MFRGGSFKEILFNLSATLRKDLESKKEELEGYVSGTVIQEATDTVDEYIAGTSKPDINTYTTTKKGEIETLATTKKSEITSHTTTKTGEITTHTNTKIAEITSHTDTKTGEITSHTDTKKSELNTYEIQLEGSLDDYIIIKKSELDDYTLEKITEIENSTGVVSESSVTDSYTGNSSSLVASQKALYDGLATKSNTHSHPYYPTSGNTSIIINGVEVTIETV
jgi:phenylalanyl-tRNA synthetase alpha subunit